MSDGALPDTVHSPMSGKRVWINQRRRSESKTKQALGSGSSFYSFVPLEFLGDADAPGAGYAFIMLANVAGTAGGDADDAGTLLLAR